MKRITVIERLRKGCYLKQFFCPRTRKNGLDGNQETRGYNR